jgi:cytochrome c oxidase subunit II
MLTTATLVYIAVLALFFFAIRGKPRNEMADESSRRTQWLLRAGLVLTPIILGVVFIASERAASALHLSPQHQDLVVQVKGWQWWWEVKYVGQSPSDTVVTANEIHVPIDRRVRLELSTGDVIHSFWVPNLQGKTDLVPGRTNVMWLEADRPGISRGQCAEYCGVQHTHMALTVVAQSAAQFDAWLTNERRTAAAPSDSLGQVGAQVFAQAGCAYCHMIRGTNSLGRFGPDLTHLSGRQTLAAGALANTAANLASWIANTQHIKPGNRMPNVPLTSAQQRAVVHYLTSLK